MHIGPASVVETLCTEVVGDGGENGDIISTDLGVSIKEEDGSTAGEQQQSAMSRLREQIAAATIPLSIANALPFTLLSSSAHGMTLTTDSVVMGSDGSLLALPTSGGLVPIRINSSLLKSEPGQLRIQPHQQLQQQQQHYYLDTTTGTVTAVSRAVALKTTTTTSSSMSIISTMTSATTTTTPSSMMTRILPSLASRPAPRTDILLQTAREVLPLPDDPADYRRVFPGRWGQVPPPPPRDAAARLLISA